LDKEGVAMERLSHNRNGAVIRVSWDELAIMHFGTAEAVRTVEGWEFPTIVGAPVEVAKALCDKLSESLKQEPTTTKD
jgi:hypothetical protein